MRGNTDHPDDFDREWAYRGAMRMAQKRSWRRFGLICPSQSGAKRKCGLLVSYWLGERNSNQK
jgi:hypothetical protein